MVEFFDLIVKTCLHDTTFTSLVVPHKISHVIGVYYTIYVSISTL